MIAFVRAILALMGLAFLLCGIALFFVPIIGWIPAIVCLFFGMGCVKGVEALEEEPA